MTRRTALVLAACLPALGSACASGPVPGSSEMTAVAPALSVERFLQAANTRDLDAMARLFGTHQGAVANRRGTPVGCAFRRLGSWFRVTQACIGRQEIELRMNAIALVLRHDDFELRSESRVAGRAHPTIRIGVSLVRGQNRYPDVPFVVVQTSQGRWLIEEIGLESVTGRRR